MGYRMMDDFTRILNRASAGQPREADRLIAVLYDEMRSLADRFLTRETPGHTLSATDLVNEAFLKLVNQDHVDWQGRTHFFAIGAQAMRRILVDHARTKHRQKRGGGRRRVEFRDDLVAHQVDLEDLLAIDQAITKLAELDRDHARIVECRFFGGMKDAEIAQLMGVTPRTVERHWAFIRAWLQRELSGIENGN
jgi:RNA polymerase sigma factor (TIGR02999 family)